MNVAPPDVESHRHRLQQVLALAGSRAPQAVATCNRNGIAPGGVSEAARGDRRDGGRSLCDAGSIGLRRSPRRLT